jgi:hypothetical protein
MQTRQWVNWMTMIRRPDGRRDWTECALGADPENMHVEKTRKPQDKNGKYVT